MNSIYFLEQAKCDLVHIVGTHHGRFPWRYPINSVSGREKISVIMYPKKCFRQ